MFGSSLILVSGTWGDPCLALKLRLCFGAGARQPFWERGPGRGGRAGSGRFREISGFPDPIPFSLKLCWAGLLGSGRWGRVNGCVAVRAEAGISLSPTPAYLIFALLQAVRGWQTDPLLVLARLRLAFDDDNKLPHVAVCTSATFHFQPSTGRPSPLPYLTSMRAEASRLSLPSCGPSTQQPRDPLNLSSPLFGGGGNVFSPSWGRGGMKGAIRFSSLALLRIENPPFFCLLIHQLLDTRR